MLLSAGADILIPNYVSRCKLKRLIHHMNNHIERKPAALCGMWKWAFRCCCNFGEKRRSHLAFKQGTDASTFNSQLNCVGGICRLATLPCGVRATGDMSNWWRFFCLLGPNVMNQMKWVTHIPHLVLYNPILSTERVDTVVDCQRRRPSGGGQGTAGCGSDKGPSWPRS